MICKHLHETIQKLGISHAIRLLQTIGPIRNPPNHSITETIRHPHKVVIRSSFPLGYASTWRKVLGLCLQVRVSDMNDFGTTMAACSNGTTSPVSTSAGPFSKRTSERQSSEPTMSLVANASSLPQYSHGEDDIDDAEDGVDNGVGRKFVHFEHTGMYLRRALGAIMVLRSNRDGVFCDVAKKEERDTYTVEYINSETDPSCIIF